MMPVEVPLTQGFIALVDTADADRVLARAWRVRRSSRPGSVAKYAMSDSRKSDSWTGAILLHRFVLCLRPDDPMVDHRDGDGLNNQRANLRIATLSENSMNRCIERAKEANKHGFRGVAYSSKNRNYRGRLVLDGVQLYTKAFATPIEAAIAWDELALKHYGEFATLNFPDLRAAA